MNQKPPGKPRVIEDVEFVQPLDNLQNGLKLFNEKSFVQNNDILEMLVSLRMCKSRKKMVFVKFVFNIR